MENLPADAVSRYAVSALNEGESFAELAGQAEDLWNTYTGTGYRIVPFLTSGWDNRPRHGVGVPWDTSSYQPYWTQQATPDDIVDHIGNARTWIDNNPDKAPARALIIYAWNEHDEGGWLCPTLGKDGLADDSRTKALKEYMEQFNK